MLSPPEWPMVELLGVCGRVSVVEYGGERLSQWVGEADWATRANLSHQLLSAALHLTHSHPRLAFYLTDISPDNIAVDNLGVARFIDLENIIIVNKTAFTSGSPGFYLY